MTVRELIERLAKLDQNAEVFVADWQEEFSPPAILNVIDNMAISNEVILSHE